MSKKLHSVLFLLVLTSASFAQRIGLQEVIDRALEENYDIRIARIDHRMAKNRNSWGNAGALPSVSLQGEATSSWIDSRQLFYNQDAQEATGARNSSQSAGVSMNWTVFDGFRMFARKERQEALQKLGKTDVRYYVEQTVSDLAIAFYRLIQERKLLEELRNNLSISRERLKLAEKRKEVGSGSELRVKEARMALNTDSSAVHQQEARVAALEVDINELMGRAPKKELIPQDSLWLREPLSEESLRDSALASNADLERSRIREMVSRKDLELEKGKRWPEVDLFGQYNFDRSASEVGFLRANRQRGPLVGARVRFDLYDGGQKRVQRKDARLEVKKRGEEREKAEQTIRAGFTKSYRNYRSALERVALEKGRVRDAREVLAIGRERFQHGSIDRIEFRTIQQNVLEAETSWIQARFQAKLEEIRILRLSGLLMKRIRG